MPAASDARVADGVAGSLDRLLVAAARVDGGAGPALREAVASGASAEQAVAAARAHNVLPLLDAATQAHPEAWPALAEHLRALRIPRAARTMALAAQVRAAVTALEGSAIPYAVLKGPAMARVHGSMGLRDFTDLDVLVAPQDAVRTAAALNASGVTDAALQQERGNGRGEMLAELPLGLRLDLHWELISNGRIRRDFAYDPRPALRRRRPVEVDGIRFHTLDATDTLLHLACHAAVSGGYRVGWYADLDRAIRLDGLDVDELVTRARAVRLGTVLAVLLERCDRQLGTPVPPGLPGRLTGSATWSAVGRALDRRISLGRGAGRHRGEIYFRATRQRLPASLCAAVRLSKATAKAPATKESSRT